MLTFRFLASFAFAVFFVAFVAASAKAQDPAVPFRDAWPNTDFSQRSIDLAEVISGGPPRDGIPSIDDPVFEPVGQTNLEPNVPVLSLELNGDARAYPLSILMWHEIVNDVVGGEPVIITFCPLCNSGAAFRATINGEVHHFGTSGMLRHSDMVMYDRQSESWWQQFTGEAIVGSLTGTELEWLAVRMESIERFEERYPEGAVLIPNNETARPYGQNPYAGYDSRDWPFLFRGEFEDGLSPLARVVAIEDQAWSLDLVREGGRSDAGDLVITWQAGQASALDARNIADGTDVGNVLVQRRSGDEFVETVYLIPFAFAFRAFHSEGVIHTELQE